MTNETVSVPEGWRSRALGEYARLVKGITYTSSQYCEPGQGAAFLTIKSIEKGGGYKAEGLKFYKGPIAKKQLLSKGDLLIANTDLTRNGDIVGCATVVPMLSYSACTMSMDLSKIEVDSDEADIPFVGYLLSTEAARKFMKDNASGSTVLHLKTSAVPLLRLPMPNSLDEQRRIAELLSTLDEQIEQTEGLIGKESAVATGLMQRLMPQGFDSKMAESDVLASAISSIEGGKSFMCSDTPAPEGTWGVLKVSAIKPNAFVENENKTVENLKLVNPKYEVKHGDLLITRANTPELVGSVCLTVNPRGKLLLCDKTLRLHVRPGLSKEYLWIWLQTPIVRRHVDAHATGTSAGMKNISQRAISQMPLHLPSPLEQLDIVQPIAAQLAHIDGLRRTRDKLRMLKTGLAADLLLGKKRLLPLN